MPLLQPEQLRLIKQNHRPATQPAPRPVPQPPAIKRRLIDRCLDGIERLLATVSYWWRRPNLTVLKPPPESDGTPPRAA